MDIHKLYLKKYSDLSNFKSTYENVVIKNHIHDFVHTGRDSGILQIVLAVILNYPSTSISPFMSMLDN